MMRITRRLRAAGPWRLNTRGAHRYSSLRSITTWTRGTHSTNLNGPVPTGLRANPLFPSFRTAAGETMLSNHGLLRFVRAAANGSVQFTRTVYGSITSVDLYGPRKSIAPWDPSLGSMMVSNVNLTASAVNGVPSWNFTSRRSANVMLFPSFE